VPGSLVRVPGSRERPRLRNAQRGAPDFATRNAAPPTSRRATRRPRLRDAQRGGPASRRATRRPRITPRNAAAPHHAAQRGSPASRATRRDANTATGGTEARRHQGIQTGGIETRMTRTSNARGWCRRGSRGTVEKRTRSQAPQVFGIALCESGTLLDRCAGPRPARHQPLLCNYLPRSLRFSVASLRTRRTGVCGCHRP
jgi:hypothetical protein